MAVSPATYEQVALEDGDTVWEYVCGQLREKPSMTQEHNRLMSRLGVQLANQLDDAEYDVRVNAGRLRTVAGNSFVPDVAVIALALADTQHDTRKLETYDLPVSFVAETWSRTTGTYDSTTKLPEYQARGDLVIWLIHPYEKLVRAFHRRPDGSYEESRHTGGPVSIGSLPGVSIDLDRLFARL